MTDRFCACGSKLGRVNASGRCRPCNAAIMNSDPEILARRIEGTRRAARQPGDAERRSAVMKRALANMSDAERERRREAGRRMSGVINSPEVRARNQSPEVRAQAGATRSARALADIPPELRQTYRDLRAKLGSASAAREVLRPQIDGTAEHARRQVLNREDAARIRHERDLGSRY